MSSRLTDPEQLKELLGIPFTPEQTACITAPPAPQVIVAGAGSGKTTVMAARVVWLVGTGQVAPEQVLGLTFTNKAAGELAERVRKALIAAGVTDPDAIDPDNPPGEPSISTYHAFAGRLLTDHGLRIGLEPTTRLLADATRYQLAARVLRDAPGPYPALTHSFPTLVGDLLALDAELAEHLVEPETLAAYDTGLLRTLESAKLSNDQLRKLPETARARGELLTLTERYRQAKSGRDLVDFGDQIALSARLALTRPEVGALLRDEFRVVLLDEYQDTSVAQRLLLSALFGHGPGGTTGHAVTAVGDPCQAIYGWRGASVANLDDFPTTSRTPTAPPPPATASARTAAAEGASSSSPTASPNRCAPGTRASRRCAPPPGPNTTASSAAPCSGPTPRRSTGSPTPSPTSCGPAPSPPRSPCSAAPPPTSRRSRPHWWPATSPSRSSGCPGCSTSPRSPTWSPSARSSRTRGPTPPSSGCSPAPAGASAPAISPCSAGGPATSSTAPPRATGTPTPTCGSPRPSRAPTRPR